MADGNNQTTIDPTSSCHGKRVLGLSCIHPEKCRDQGMCAITPLSDAASLLPVRDLIEVEAIGSYRDAETGEIVGIRVVGEMDRHTGTTRARFTLRSVSLNEPTHIKIGCFQDRKRG